MDALEHNNKLPPAAAAAPKLKQPSKIDAGHLANLNALFGAGAPKQPKLTAKVTSFVQEKSTASGKLNKAVLEELMKKLGIKIEETKKKVNELESGSNKTADEESLLAELKALQAQLEQEEQALKARLAEMEATDRAMAEVLQAGEELDAEERAKAKKALEESDRAYAESLQKQLASGAAPAPAPVPAAPAPVPVPAAAAPAAALAQLNDAIEKIGTGSKVEEDEDDFVELTGKAEGSTGIGNDFINVLSNMWYQITKPSDKSKDEVKKS